MEEQRVEYAGFWVRMGASLIDMLLMMLITFPLLASIYGWDVLFDETRGYSPADFLISQVLPAIATIAFWIMKQATPGKMVISARIVDAVTGQAPSSGQLVGRYCAYFISMLPLFLGVFWILFDRKRQAWHDRLAGTVVVREVCRGPEPVRFVQT